MIDANFSSPNLGAHLKIIDPEKTLHDVLDRTANFSEAIHKFENFDILPSAIFNRKKINPFELRNKIKTLKNKYDIIIIDSSPARHGKKRSSL